jgi:hypothetical protein
MLMALKKVPIFEPSSSFQVKPINCRSNPPSHCAGYFCEDFQNWCDYGYPGIPQFRDFLEVRIDFCWLWHVQSEQAKKNIVVSCIHPKAARLPVAHPRPYPCSRAHISHEVGIGAVTACQLDVDGKFNAFRKIRNRAGGKGNISINTKYANI